MMDWFMILVGGFLGSSHCVGMCGGFALALGASGRTGGFGLLRQVVYCLGRVFTYSVAGALAGYAGWRLTNLLPSVVHVQAYLCIGAGVLLMVQGLASTGLLRWPRSYNAANPKTISLEILPPERAEANPFSESASCLGPSMFAALLSATRMRSVFLAGLVNGLLPCGLVYAFLGLAASAGGLVYGAATMALFGLGTLPVMTFVGVGGSLLGLAVRRRILTVAAWCVVITGILSVFRGLGFIHYEGVLQPPECPLCR